MPSRWSSVASPWSSEGSPWTCGQPPWGLSGAGAARSTQALDRSPTLHHWTNWRASRTLWCGLRAVCWPASEHFKPSSCPASPQMLQPPHSSTPSVHLVTQCWQPQVAPQLSKGVLPMLACSAEAGLRLLVHALQANWIDVQGVPQTSFRLPEAPHSAFEESVFDLHGQV